MKLRSLQKDIQGIIDLGVVIMIVVGFVGMIVISFIIYQVQISLGSGATSAYNATAANITKGYDSAISLLLVSITIFILALAISSLLLLSGRRD